MNHKNQFSVTRFKNRNGVVSFRIEGRLIPTNQMITSRSIFQTATALLFTMCFSACLRTTDFMSTRTVLLDTRIHALFAADMDSNRILIPGVMEQCFGVEPGVTKGLVISKLIAKSKLSDEVTIIDRNGKLIFQVLGCSLDPNVWIKHSYVFVFDQDDKLLRTGVNVQRGPIELLRFQ